MESFQRAVLTALLVCLLAPALLGAAALKGDLENIRKKIESEKKDLSRLKDKETSVLQSLGKIQTDLAARTKELNQAAAKLSSIGTELQAKEAEAERLAASIAARQSLLAKRAAALYRWQRSGSPLVVFNGSASLAGFMQRRHYLEAALSFDRDLLAKLDAESERQTALRAELSEKKAELADQQRTLGAAKQAVAQEAQKKKLLLTSVRREKQTRLRALQEMQAAAQRLEKMLEEIARRALAKPKAAPSLPSPGSDSKHCGAAWNGRSMAGSPHPSASTSTRCSLPRSSAMASTSKRRWARRSRRWRRAG